MITVSRSELKMQIVPDDSPDTSYLEQEGFESRLAEYRNGAFGFVGVRAVCELPIPYGVDAILTPVHSPGLWGIESDSDGAYLQEVFVEECSVLADMLAELGVSIQE